MASEGHTQFAVVTGASSGIGFELAKGTRTKKAEKRREAAKKAARTRAKAGG